MPKAHASEWIHSCMMLALVSLAMSLVSAAWLCQLLQFALDDTRGLCPGHKVTPTESSVAGGEYDNTQSQAVKKKKDQIKFGKKF